MGWTLRSTSPDFSGASQKQRHHPFHPGPQMWEGESWGAGKVGGERPRLRGPHSGALQDSRLFFPVLSLLHLCLSPCLSLSFSVSPLVSLSVPIFASVCFSDCPVLSFLSLSVFVTLSLPISASPCPSLCGCPPASSSPSVSRPQCPRSPGWPLGASGEARGRRARRQDWGAAPAEGRARAGWRVLPRELGAGGGGGGGGRALGALQATRAGRSIWEGDAPRCLSLTAAICRHLTAFHLRSDRN